MAPATDCTKLKESLKKLLDAQAELRRDYRAKMDDLSQEMERLLAGEPGIGVILREVEGHFADTWQGRYKQPYVYSYAADRPHMKRLIKSLGVDELKARMTRYVGNDDRFYASARHSFRLFVSTVNAHAAPADAPLLEKAETVWDRVLARIQPTINGHQFHKWLKPTTLVREERDGLTIRVPAPEFVPWLNKHYGDDIQKAVYIELGAIVPVAYVVDGEELAG